MNPKMHTLGATLLPLAILKLNNYIHIEKYIDMLPQITTINLYGQYPSIEIILGSIISANLPDIDQTFGFFRNKKTKRKRKLLRHRGQTHNLIFPALLLIVSVFLQTPFIFGFAIGLISHVLLDWLNEKGAELLYPFTQKNYKAPKFFQIKYEGIGEKLLFLTMCIGIVLCLVDVNVIINIILKMKGWLQCLN
jgi:membrane-bound metal-dependent hydrolase YbcI (DUF457 family)